MGFLAIVPRNQLRSFPVLWSPAAADPAIFYVGFGMGGRAPTLVSLSALADCQV
jgi:hypothetical protein